MTILSDRSSFEIRGKRPFDHDGYHGNHLPPNFKHPKGNTIRDFPIQRNAVPSPIQAQSSEVVPFSGFSKDIAKPSKNSVPSVTGYKPTKSMAPHDKVNGKDSPFDLTGKKSFDCDGCRCRGFPPRQWNPSPIQARTSEVVPFRGNFKDISKPSKISVPNVMGSKPTKSKVPRDNVNGKDSLFDLTGKKSFDHDGSRCRGFPPRQWNAVPSRIEAETSKVLSFRGNYKDNAEPSKNSVPSVKGSKPTKSMVPHNNVNGKDSPFDLTGKKSFDRDGSHSRSFPPNFRRRTVDAVRDFPKHCGALAPRITMRRSDENLEAVEEGGFVKPSEISLPSVKKSDTTKSMVARDNVKAIKQDLKVDNLDKVLNEPFLSNIAETLVQAKSVDASDNFKFPSQPFLRVRKYPPPRKGVPVFRDFPPRCGSFNYASDSKDFANKSSLDSRPLVKLTRIDMKPKGEQIQHGHASERKLEKNALEVTVCEVQAEHTPHQLIGDESCKQIHEDFYVGNSSSNSSDLMLLPFEEYGEGNSSEDGNDTINAADTHNSVLLQSQDRTEAFKQIYTNDRSLVLQAANQSDTLLDYEEKHKNTFVSEEFNLNIVPFDDSQTVVRRDKVKEALNLFEEIFTKLLVDHEALGQVYVEAAMLLRRQQKWVNTEQLLGPVPGVEVGDQFRFRAELVIVGLHHQFQGGIDYLKKDGRILATSIVASGRYANAAEFSDVLIYSGQGGNPMIEKKKQPQDQKLERGNLALKNSMDARTPVRVIRGRQTLRVKTTKSNLTYVYDGLYVVTKCTQERGPYGKLVYMFQLNRMLGQTKVNRRNVGMSSKSKLGRLRCLVNDISQGKEKIPIRLVNNVDDEKPPLFNYITHMTYPESCTRSMPIGCDCIDGSMCLEKCQCIIKNGGEVPFNYNDAIFREKPFVYECGPSCKCHSSCKNRVSQYGIRYQLEVFKTESRGWGVRSRNYISVGSFVCEYVGELIRDKEAEQRIGNDEYLFAIGKDKNHNSLKSEASNDDGFTIDAAHYGNVGRFINHSCSPNLYARKVLHDHDNGQLSHIMFFAVKGIPPLQELTYYYNYKLDQVCDGNGNIKRKACNCGSRECRGRMY